MLARLESRTAAAADVLAERKRQVTAEGWTPGHDDEYEHGELADAAGCYALSSELFDCAGEPPRPWPWPDEWWKPTSRRRDLVKAGALILAEIERIDRAGSGREGKNQPGMVVAVHIDAGDFVKFRGQVYEVKETDFDDHDVTLWFVCGEALKCAAGCQIEVVSAPGETE
ncbi:EaD family phage protein [Raoultella planticola ATCC 33531]|nr:EaD family phage protein [Raoultella planticola ATCC 33531]